MDGGVWGGPQVGGEATIQGTGEQEDTPLFTHLYCMHAYTTIYGMHTTTPHPPIRAMYGRMGAPQYRVHSTPYSMIWYEYGAHMSTMGTPISTIMTCEYVLMGGKRDECTCYYGMMGCRDDPLAPLLQLL